MNTFNLPRNVGLDRLKASGQYPSPLDREPFPTSRSDQKSEGVEKQRKTRRSLGNRRGNLNVSHKIFCFPVSSIYSSLMLAKSRIVALKCGTVISRINRAERIHKSRVQISERDIHNSFPSLSLTNVRLFSTDKSKTTTGTATTSKKTTGIDKQRVDRSILEEVLMPEEEEPKTTAQKGFISCLSGAY